MNLKKYLSKEESIFILLILFLILIFSFTLFGVTGIRFVFGIVIMWLPFYFILSDFEFTTSEKFVFSILMAITIFPSIVFLIGFITSFKIAIAITFLLLTALSFLIKKIKRGNQSKC